MREILSTVPFRLSAAPRAGVVHIVGAGPGDPDLLTVKALRLLTTADVVVYDRLVSDAILKLIGKGARRIDVGKARGRHPTPQGRIEEILVEEARKGLTVVRLKGGDPFVFGRGGEELEAVRAAGIEAHVVPGVSAALGCAASAGLPLTHRDHAQAVSFVTGRGRSGSDVPDFTGLAGPGRTLAVYMGRDRAAAIAQALLAQGLDPATPVAIVENGTRPDERVLKGDLAGLAELARATTPDAPALLFVGDTAALAAERGQPLPHKTEAAA
jgi:uroporphyrin-III C-methyltransferase/precorrin-2 dehydrogenase/sirohydrochlorin ferrochelatase